MTKTPGSTSDAVRATATTLRFGARNGSESLPLPIPAPSRTDGSTITKEFLPSISPSAMRGCMVHIHKTAVFAGRHIKLRV